MEKKQLFFILLSIAVFSTALTVFLSLYIQASSFTILNRVFRISLFPEIPLWGCVFILLILLWQFLSRVESRFLSADYSSRLRENTLVLLPLSFFLLSPLLLQYHLTSDDLRHRLRLFAVLVLLSLIYLKTVQLFRGVEAKTMILDRLEQSLSRLPLKKKLLILFLVAFVLYNLATFILVAKGVTFSGDEPYYLLTAHSLLKDGDINVADNYARQDYFHFYSKERFPHLKLGIYAREGVKGPGYLYPVNLPGISVLMLPHYWLSRFFEGKTLTFILKGSLSIWAVLLGLQLYLLSRNLWRKERISLLLWFLYSFTAPVLFYATSLYPEIPIAFFSLFVYRKMSSGAGIGRLGAVSAGFFLGLFPWFGLKYNMIFWPLLLVSLYFLLVHHRSPQKVLLFLIFPLLSQALFYGFIHTLYGTFSPVAVYEGVMTPEKAREFREIMVKLPVMLRIDSFLDYFFDQRDGLLLYSPMYFFFFLGLIEIFRRSKRDLLILIFISLPFIFNYAFFTHRQGYCPQGRILTPISWIGFFLIGYFLVHNRNKFYDFLFRLAAASSLVIAVILLLNPSFLYQPTTHEFTFRGGDLFIHLSNLHLYLPDFFPSFIKVNNLGYIPNYIWLAMILGFVITYIRRKPSGLKPDFSFHAFFVFCAVLAAFFIFALFPRTVLLHPRNVSFPTGEKLAFYSLSRTARMKEPGQFFLAKDGRTYTFSFTSWRKLEKLDLEFGSPGADYEVRLNLFDLPLFYGETSGEIKTIDYTLPPSYPYKKTNLYQVILFLEKKTDGSPAEEGFFLRIRPSYRGVRDSITP